MLWLIALHRTYNLQICWCKRNFSSYSYNCKREDYYDARYIISQVGSALHKRHDKPVSLQGYDFFAGELITDLLRNKLYSVAEKD
jgi:hypothetical protein